MQYIRELVTLRGRINRRTFVLWMLPIVAVATFIASTTELFICAFWLISPILVPLCVLRLHDIGCSGWGSLTALIPGGNIVLVLILSVRRGTPGPNFYSPIDPCHNLNVEDGAGAFVLEIVRLGGCRTGVRLLLDGKAVCHLGKNRRVSFRLPRKTVSVAVESPQGILREMLVDPGVSKGVRISFAVHSFRLLYLTVPALMLRPFRVDILGRQHLPDGEIPVDSRPRRLKPLEKREILKTISLSEGKDWIGAIAVLTTIIELFILFLPTNIPGILFDPLWRGILLCVSFPGVFYMLFILLAVLSSKLRHRVPTAVDESAPYILYLRSFADDDKMSRSVDSFAQFGRTEEEVLVDILSDIAPVVAIGRPAERNMPFGAYRVYVDDAHWRQRVSELANGAKYVVLRLGTTENFMWEVDRCLQTVDISRLLFLIPRGMVGSRIWNALREKMPSFDWSEASSEAQKIDWFGWRRGSSFGWLRFENSHVCFTALRRAFNPFTVNYVEKQREALSPVFWASGSLYNNLFCASPADIRARRWKSVYVIIIFLALTGKWILDWYLPISEPLQAAISNNAVHSCKDISPSASSIRLVDNVYIPMPAGLGKDDGASLNTWDTEGYSVLKAWGPVTNGLAKSYYTFGRVKLPADVCECDQFNEFYLACKSNPQSICRENARIIDCASGCVSFHEDVSDSIGCPAVECGARFMVAGRIISISIIRFGHDKESTNRILGALRVELEEWIASVRAESRVADNKAKAIAGDDIRIGQGKIPAPTGCVPVYHFAEIATALYIDDDDPNGGCWDCLATYVSDGFDGRMPGRESFQLFRIKELRRCRYGVDSHQQYKRILASCRGLAHDGRKSGNAYHEVLDGVFSQSVKVEPADGSSSDTFNVISELLLDVGGTVLVLEVRSTTGTNGNVQHVEKTHCRLLQEWRRKIETKLKNVSDLGGSTPDVEMKTAMFST